ncbi:hypothetical protein [Clostridioides sp. ES-S-0108-01]|uniref:hypothetical protein n=1 Tax=Clostridioides sp. ES-S-0108-01 TaxID=2770773 RepID=UPI001D0C0E90
MHYFCKFLDDGDYPPYMHSNEYIEKFKEYFLNNYLGDIPIVIFVGEMLLSELRLK